MADNNVVLTNVKLIKGITDGLQDALLNVLIDESRARVLAYINQSRAVRLDAVPDELNYVLQDVTVMRFNKLNAEGAKADSEEGRSYTWQDSYLDEHKDALSVYQDANDDAHKPKPGRIFVY